MAVLALDLGGTKLASALFDEGGNILKRDAVPLEGKGGGDVGLLIQSVVRRFRGDGRHIDAVGLSVPGIARSTTGTVWAPNIPGWDDYPVIDDIRRIVPDTPVVMDSDRACCMLGELWLGKARSCTDAVYLAVGTGIGAGILCGGKILRGAHDIAGSIGWMALDRPFRDPYAETGCFEYYASGEGIARLTRECLEQDEGYAGQLRRVSESELTAHHVFTAYEDGDPLAERVIAECIQYWGMAVANLVSLFNPEKIIFGGGVFGPALRFLSAIGDEARRWAQPISMAKVRLEASELHGNAAIHGAGFLALKSVSHDNAS
jgi:glucokinase